MRRNRPCHRHRRAVKAEDIGDATRRDIQGAARSSIGIQQCRVLVQGDM